MTDMGMTPGDQTIDLDLGGIDAIHGWMPVPSGVYVLQVVTAQVVPTKKGGRQIEFTDHICEGPLSSRSIGIQRVWIPARDSVSPDKWEATAGFFKGKIESITGKPYTGQINVREMIGLKFKGLVVLQDNGYGPQNEITTYLPLTADTSSVAIPTSTPRPQNGGSAPDSAAGGRFRI